jgi:acyl-CoA synthetase (NDP forming)
MIQDDTGRSRISTREALSEADSKKLLADYGVPVVREITASDLNEATEAASTLGFPVVLKGLGAKLTHKTEMGLVHLGLYSREDVLAAADKIQTSAGKDLEGFLVQPQIDGQREFVAGLFRDPQFGPVIMFGLGGVFTEALRDTTLRLAPINESDAKTMLGELESSGMLGAFRGQAPADRAALIQTLTGLSRLAVERPDVAEIDLNPLKITPSGQVVAVDALVVLGEAPPTARKRPHVDVSEVRVLFHPRSVAFVGASASFRKWGHLLFTNVLAGGYEGEVYLVNPKADTIAGRKVYKSVTDIPGEVDVAVVTVPAALVLDLLPEFQAKGIKRVILITSGFAEVGPEGRALEEQLVADASSRGILILGPNTMGTCNPYHKFYCLGSHVRPHPGPTAFVSQSGNMGVQLLSFAESHGIGIRSFAGSGNEAMLTIEDALDTFAVDDLTMTVLLYIESVKDGRRFFESAQRVSRRKPVVVLKGGRTEAGTRAAASHTGALATDNHVFDAACRQAGIVLADNPTDLLDLSAAFSSLPLPKGRKVAIMTLGGGWGVITSDLCERYGLKLPDLPDDIVKAIDPLLPPFWSRANPVDLVGDTNLDVPLKVMEILMAWDGCDAVINLGIWGRKRGLKKMIESTLQVDPDAGAEEMNQIYEAMVQYEHTYVNHLVGLMQQYHKPILGVSLVSGEDDKTVIDVDESKYKGIFFSTPERAVKALSEMCVYDQWLDREGVPLEQRGFRR